MIADGAVPLAEVTRGPLVESVHVGHAVVADARGVIAAWGEADTTLLPRSSCKMLQALPLVESGAADAARLGDEQLALACASHQGAAIHVGTVARWLADIGRGEGDLRCGPQVPGDRAERARLREERRAPDQMHNNCSGKHAGFLTLAAHLRSGAEYVDVEHPVQRAVLAAFEEMTEEPSRGYGIDGCSAPNFACSLAGLAQAMARMARPESLGGRRADAARRLVAAMMRHPQLVAGEERACTQIMAAVPGRVAVKVGAEGVFCAILPERGLGVALKVVDGATRGAEAAITALLVRLGVLGAANPAARKWGWPSQVNRRGITVGAIRPAASLWQEGRPL